MTPPDIVEVPVGVRDTMRISTNSESACCSLIAYIHVGRIPVKVRLHGTYIRRVPHSILGPIRHHRKRFVRWSFSAKSYDPSAQDDETPEVIEKGSWDPSVCFAKE